MHISKVNFQGIESNLEHIIEGSWGYNGKERYELWTNLKYSDENELIAKEFMNFDRGLYYKEINEDLVNALLNDK